MKKVLSLAVAVLALSAPHHATARTQTKDAKAAPAAEKTNKAKSGSSSATDKTEAKNDPKKSGKSDKKKKNDSKKPAESSSTASAAPISGTESNSSTSDAPAKTVATVPGGSPAPKSDPASSKTNVPTSTSAATNVPALALTNVYRVGVGDVLDIRLLNASTQESTLFTVLAGGLLEYPLAGEPLQAAGLTTEEVSARLTPRIKLYEKPQVVVSVRQYASHNVIVTGLVNDPGTKVLRREAVPLYVVLAEAQPRPEAGRATIMRPGGQSITIDLSDTAATSALVVPGDVIRLSAPPPPQPQYFYIGGQINSPGQKDFHKGLTLTQAVLASGGVARFAGNEVKVLRQGPDGRLVMTKYNLKKIEEGQIPDPALQPGDRLEVSRRGW